MHGEHRVPAHERVPVLQVVLHHRDQWLEDLCLLELAQEAQRAPADVLVRVHQVIPQVVTARGAEGRRRRVSHTERTTTAARLRGISGGATGTSAAGWARRRASGRAPRARKPPRRGGVHARRASSWRGAGAQARGEREAEGARVKRALDARDKDHLRQQLAIGPRLLNDLPVDEEQLLDLVVVARHAEADDGHQQLGHHFAVQQQRYERRQA